MPVLSKFNVTYQIVTEESAAEGEAAELGFIGEGLSLRDALETVRETRTSQVDGVESVEANESPVRSPRWVTINNGREFLTGEFESRSIHFPENLTDATRLRICRLLGIKC